MRSLTVVILTIIVSLTTFASARADKNLRLVRKSITVLFEYQDESNCLPRRRRILKIAYGKEWKPSLPWQVSEMLKNDKELASNLAALIRRGDHFTATVVTDYPATEKFPVSSPFTEEITIPDSWEPETNDPCTTLRSMFLHEVAHLVDSGARCLPGDFGADGVHRLNEVTSMDLAMAEGWANYNQAKISDCFLDKIAHSTNSLVMENVSSTRTKPSYATLFQPVFLDYLSCEGSIALFLSLLSRSSSKSNSVLSAFFKINEENPMGTTFEKSRIARFISKYVELFPEESMSVFVALDIATDFTADDMEFTYFDETQGKCYIEVRKTLKAKVRVNSLDGTDFYTRLETHKILVEMTSTENTQTSEDLSFSGFELID